ncbi:MAG: chemotaxis-specific protein-glutamate methyltransferase CheB [Microscillaceae bacterium]|nr:chemotaxis-specific protein-glutamate methyltransferase CheB [Microscillaceae bacterium]
MPKNIEILLADDSGFMRLLLKQMIEQEPDLSVLGTAADGQEAYEKACQLRPDVLVLDLVMAPYDGLFAIEKIMAECPCPIVLLSGLSEKEPETVFRALSMGALDFVSKPSGAFHSHIRQVQPLLCQKIRLAAQLSIAAHKKNPQEKSNNYPHTFAATLPYEVVLLGGSTGGTIGIEFILKNLPQNLPVPVVIAQHIPLRFAFSFGERLSGLCPFEIKISQSKRPLLPNQVYLLNPEENWEITLCQNQACLLSTPTLFAAYNHPSIDGLWCSAAEVFGAKTLAILLSGMGKDGALGMQAIQRQNGLTIAQNEATCVVFGMPKAAIELEAATHILALEDIPGFITSSFSD